MTTNPMTQEEPSLGQVFSAAKETRGNSHQAVRDYILLTHGESVTPQTVANYHHDASLTHDPITVAMIAEFYGLTLDELPSEDRDACLRAHRVLAGRGGEWYAPGDSNPEPSDYGSLADAA